MDLMISRIADFLDNMCVFPQAAILFLSRSPEYQDIKRQEMKSLLAAVKSRLPIKCSLVGCVGAGIVGHTEGEKPEEIEMAEGVSLLIIPRIDGISTHVFNMSCTDVRYNRTVKERWERSLSIPPEKRVKFAILFAKGDTYNLDIIGKVASGIWQVCLVQTHFLGHVFLGGLIHESIPSLYSTPPLPTNLFTEGRTFFMKNITRGWAFVRRVTWNICYSPHAWYQDGGIHRYSATGLSSLTSFAMLLMLYLDI